MEIRLALGDEQEREDKMEGECQSQHQEEDPAQGIDSLGEMAPFVEAVNQAGRQREHAVEGGGQHAVDREEIGGEDDPGIHPVGQDMSPLQADMEAVGHCAAEELHPERMRHLMAEDIGKHERLSGDDSKEDAEDQESRGEASEGAVREQAAVH